MHKIIAHRFQTHESCQNPQTPENTLRALDLAIEKGIKHFEFDVMMSGEAGFFINHDLLIPNRPKHIRENIFLAMRNSELRECGLDLLPDVLARAKQHNLWLNIEIKIPSFAWLKDYPEFKYYYLNLEIENGLSHLGAAINQPLDDFLDMSKTNDELIISDIYQNFLIHFLLIELSAVDFLDGNYVISSFDFGFLKKLNDLPASAFEYDNHAEHNTKPVKTVKPIERLNLAALAHKEEELAKILKICKSKHKDKQIKLQALHLNYMLFIMYSYETNVLADLFDWKAFKKIGTQFHASQNPDKNAAINPTALRLYTVNDWGLAKALQEKNCDFFTDIYADGVDETKVYERYSRIT